MLRLALPALLALSSVVASAQTRLLREPTVSDHQIAFAYAGDIWTVGRAGGEARRVTTFPGVESLPHFSPDGSQIAFSGAYDGNVDVYVVPTGGGEPRRLTWHPSADLVRGWTDDGRVLFASGRDNAPRPEPALFTLAPGDAVPERLPLGRAFEGDLQGRRLAYEKVNRWDPRMARLPGRPGAAHPPPRPRLARRDDGPVGGDGRRRAGLDRGDRLLPLRPRRRRQRLGLRHALGPSPPAHAPRRLRREAPRRRGRGGRLRAGRDAPPPRPGYGRGDAAPDHRPRRHPLGTDALGERRRGHHERLALADGPARPRRGPRRGVHRPRRDGRLAQPLAGVGRRRPLPGVVPRRPARRVVLGRLGRVSAPDRGAGRDRRAARRRPPRPLVLLRADVVARRRAHRVHGHRPEPLDPRPGERAHDACRWRQLRAPRAVPRPDVVAGRPLPSPTPSGTPTSSAG